MKLIMKADDGSNYEWEAKAAYVVLIEPEDGGDVTMSIIGKTNPSEIISGVAHTLYSFFDNIADKDDEDKKMLWKLFKKEYKMSADAGSYSVVKNETKPIEKG